jgi:hypothetical protein
MKTKLSLGPGTEDVANRLQLAGEFHVFRGYFSNEKVQSRLDSLSLRSQGKPKEAQNNVNDKAPADLRGVFTLKDGLLNFPQLHFLIPGTHVNMAGNYSLDGRTFDFRGTVRLDAKLSQMTTGWKSILLKPVDRFFSKDGAGTEVPVKVTGTEAAPHFGLDFHDHSKNEHKVFEKNFDSAKR